MDIMLMYHTVIPILVQALRLILNWIPEKVEINLIGTILKYWFRLEFRDFQNVHLV